MFCGRKESLRQMRRVRNRVVAEQQNAFIRVRRQQRLAGGSGR